MKSKGVAYLLWFFFGLLSAHRFYIGKNGTGILYLVTGQLFLIGWFIDLFILGGMVDRINLENGYTGPSINSYQNSTVKVNTAPED